MHVGIISDLDDARATQLMTAESLTHVATLYLPQLSSHEKQPHPIILSFIQAADSVSI
jgi:CTP synthase (UTP-ammonia lyase)